jgi:hypothetical protein
VKTDAISVGTPQNAVATADSDTQITVSWDAVALPEGEDGTVAYTLVAYDDEAHTAGEAVLAEKTAETAFVHAELPPNTAKYYTVRAVADVGGMEISGEEVALASATTLEAVAESAAGAAASSGASAGAGTGKEAEARAVAQGIADGIGGGSDLERINAAAYAVSQYTARGVYSTSGEDYRTAYGVFIKGEFSCAGATRALGMVLEYMGYTNWTHTNPNQWVHQWCVVHTASGDIWADASFIGAGMADYGTESPIFVNQVEQIRANPGANQSGYNYLVSIGRI